MHENSDQNKPRKVTEMATNQTQSSFEKINFLLAIPGHQLLTKDNRQSVIRYILLCMCFAKCLSDAAIDTRRALISEEVTLFHVADIFLHFFIISFHITMIIKRPKITNFLMTTLWQVDKTGSQRLWRVAWRCVLYYWFNWFLHNCLFLCFENPFGACQWKAEHIFDFRPNVTVTSAAISQVVFFYEVCVSGNWMVLSF
jgi:hypothetical protein